MPETVVEPRVETERQTAGLWLAVCTLLALVLIAAARLKGGYVDEYWTMGFADSTLPLKRAFQAWSMDTGHPIGFYVISRIGDLLLAPDVFIRRLANLLFFGFAVFCAWRLGKHAREFGLVYVASVAASPYVVERFAEYRASFLALMITAVLVLRLRAITSAGTARTQDSIVVALLMGSLGLSDYPVAIAGFALCGALALLSLVERNTKTLVPAAAGLGACSLVVAVSLANAARFTMYPPPYFQSMGGLIRDVAIVMATAALPCAVIAGLALMKLRESRRPLHDIVTGDRFAIFLMLSISLMLAAFLIINFATHSLIRRQLFGIIPIATALLLTLAWPHLRLRPRIVALIAINLLAVSGATAVGLRSKPYFDRFGAEMAQAQRSCRTLRIYAVLPEQITGTKDNPFPTRNQVFLGFADVAQRHHLRIRHDFPANWVDECGAIIWSENLWVNGKPTSQMVARKLGLSEQLLAGATMEYVDQSLMMRVPPPR